MFARQLKQFCQILGMILSEPGGVTFTRLAMITNVFIIRLTIVLLD